MRGALRLVLLSTPVACLLAARLLQPSAPAAREAVVRATVEPTLSLNIDLTIEAPPEAAGRAAGVLVAELTAGDPIHDLVLALRLPPGVRALDAADLGLPGGSMPEGARRAIRIPLAAAAGRHPVQIEARFTLADGRTFTTRQGTMLAAGVPQEAPGRSHLGAWEVPAIRSGDRPR